MAPGVHDAETGEANNRPAKASGRARYRFDIESGQRPELPHHPPRAFPYWNLWLMALACGLNQGCLPERCPSQSEAAIELVGASPLHAKTSTSLPGGKRENKSQKGRVPQWVEQAVSLAERAAKSCEFAKEFQGKSAKRTPLRIRPTLADSMSAIIPVPRPALKSWSTNHLGPQRHPATRVNAGRHGWPVLTQFSQHAEPTKHKPRCAAGRVAPVDSRKNCDKPPTSRPVPSA